MMMMKWPSERIIRRKVMTGITVDRMGTIRTYSGEHRMKYAGVGQGSIVKNVAKVIPQLNKM